MGDNSRLCQTQRANIRMQALHQFVSESIERDLDKLVNLFCVCRDAITVLYSVIATFIMRRLLLLLACAPLLAA